MECLSSDSQKRVGDYNAPEGQESYNLTNTRKAREFHSSKTFIVPSITILLNLFRSRELWLSRFKNAIWAFQSILSLTWIRTLMYTRGWDRTVSPDPSNTWTHVSAIFGEESEEGSCARAGHMSKRGLIFYFVMALSPSSGQTWYWANVTL